MHSVRNCFLVAVLAVATLLVSHTMLQAQRLGMPPGSPGIVKPPATESKPAKPSKLEEMLAEALRNNPDLRVAAATITKAEAELQRIRLQVIQQVVTLHYAIEKAQAEVAAAQRALDRAERLKSNRVISSEECELIQERLAAAKLRLEAVQVESTSLLGKAPREASLRKTVEYLTFSGQTPELKWKIVESPLAIEYGYSVPARPTSRMEKLRKALETPVKVTCEQEKLSEVLKDLQKQAPGLVIHCRSSGSHLRVSLHFEEPLPVATILQAIEDDLGGGAADDQMRFAVRDYGLLMTPRTSLPPGALSPQEFLRRTPGEKPKPEK